MRYKSIDFTILGVILFLLAICGAVCFVKLLFTKHKSFKNKKEALVIYGSWLILWLWAFNNSFYLSYPLFVEYGELIDNLPEQFVYIINSILVTLAFIIIMFLVVILLGEKIKKHILIGYLAYFVSWFYTDYSESFAYIVASWKWMPMGVVSFIHKGYNVLFWCYVIGFLAYGIYYKIKTKSIENK